MLSQIIHIKCCVSLTSLAYVLPQISPRIMMASVEMYKRDLEVFAHMQLPRFHMPSSFHDRADSSLVLLVRQCPYLHTLVMAVLVVVVEMLLHRTCFMSAFPIPL